MRLNHLIPKRKILSLDIGTYCIKGIVGKETGHEIVIDKHFVIPTPKRAYDDGTIAEKGLIHYVLDDALGKNGIRARAKDVYLTINSSKMLVREMTIPKVRPEEIGEVLSFQIGDYIPGDSESYIIQHRVIGPTHQDGVDKLNILLIGIPRMIVDNHFELLRDLDLNPIILDYQPNSIGKLLRYNNLINGEYPTGNITFAIIDLGQESTKVSIIKDETIYVSRVIDVAGSHIDQSVFNIMDNNEEEIRTLKMGIEDINREELDISSNAVRDVLNNLNGRIGMIFRYYLSRNPDNRIHMILLYGGHSNLKGIEDFYTNYFNIPSVRIEALDRLVFEGDLYTYANPIGALIRRADAGL